MGLLDVVRRESEGSPLPSSAAMCSGSDRPPVVCGALLRLGLATNWDASEPVPALTKRQYCNAIREEVSSGEHGHYLKREDLVAAAERLGFGDPYSMTNSELRKAFSRRHGFEPGTGGDTKAGLRKEELHGLAMGVLRESHGG